jgi:hypothetical protein
MSLFFNFGKKGGKEVVTDKKDKPVTVPNTDWSKNRYYTVGKKNASVVKKDRKSGRKSKTSIKFNRDPDYLYYVDGKGTLMRSPRVNR